MVTRGAELEDLFAEGDRLADLGKHRAALRLFLAAAKRGHCASMERVGVQVGSGQGTRPDPLAAIRWLLCARRLGSSMAAHNLAITYAEVGRWLLAARWWARAEAEGHRDAGVDLAICLLEGKGTRRDPRRARRLLLRAVREPRPYAIAEVDRERAMALLGVMAARAATGRRNPAQARRWLERADRDHDYPEARRVLRSLETGVPSYVDVARFPPWSR
jgi:TPR repeat protein